METSRICATLELIWYSALYITTGLVSIRRNVSEDFRPCLGVNHPVIGEALGMLDTKG